MLALLGDIHGSMPRLQTAARTAADYGATALIQVGDFGFSHQVLTWLQHYDAPLFIYFIDGNHEEFEWLPKSADVTAVDARGQVLYCPRGTVLEIDGKRIGFLGGADSVDKDIRLSMRAQYKFGGYWSPQEVITDEDVRTLLDNADEPLDLLITHGPPQEIVERHFNREDLRLFGLEPSWTSPSALLLDEAWTKLGKPQLFCGHMHREVYGPNYAILDINQLLFIP